MENLTVKQTVDAISRIVSQTSSSRKDEERVMMAMLNDKSYVVNSYNKDEVVPYCPSKDARDMCASMLVSTTGISKDEAANLADMHEFSKQEANSMIRISKEYVYTYIQTGRKLQLGTRDNIDVGLSLKDVKSRTTGVPKPIGKDAEGKTIYEFPKVQTKPYKSIRVHATCPSHIK